MSTVKENILHLLVNGQGKYFSGSELAKQLGVSRNAVWKSVKQLQSAGYQIDAVTNKGYTFISEDDMLSDACIQKYLSTKALGRNLQIFPSLESTNKTAKTMAAQGAPDGTVIIADDACIQKYLSTKALGRNLQIFPSLESTNKTAKTMAAQGAPDGTVIIAETQSQGHGRYGRPFFSPEKSGIYMSVLLRPHLKPEDALLLTSCAAVAIAQAIESLADVSVQIKWVNDLFINNKKICGILTEAGIGFENGALDYVVAQAIESLADVSVQIKWVNDLFINNKKICGILTEAGIGFENGALDYVVIGIGINAGKVTFPDDLKSIATSIENESDIPISRNRLIAEVLNKLEAHIQTMHNRSFLSESRKRSILLGKEINVITMNETYPAKALEINDDGFLIVEAKGKRHVLNSGEVSIRI